VLVDAGLSRRETFRRLRSIGESPEPLDAILISHEHSDHTGGLAAIATARNTPVFVNALTRQALLAEAEAARRPAGAPEPRRARAASANGGRERPATNQANTPRDAHHAHWPAAALWAMAAGGGPALAAPNGQPAAADTRAAGDGDSAAKAKPQPVFEVFRTGQKFQVGDVEIESFTVPHDAADPVAFRLTAEGVSIGVCTDLGYLPDSVKFHLAGCACLVLESNHDLDMLKVGPYPWSVKQRVMSRTGHLSNNAVSDFLLGDFDAQALVLVLAHLSENNNHPEIARLSAAMALDARRAARTRLVVSAQSAATEVFRF